MIFHDRRDAGKKLSRRLMKYANKDVVVLGVPRGGIIVAAEVAEALKAPLDVIIARKIGAPQNTELAVGAVTVDGAIMRDETLLSCLHIPDLYINAEAKRQRLEIERQLRDYRGNAPPLDLVGKTVIAVDDGVATGMTMKAALRSLASLGPSRVVLALPVAPPETVAELRREVDEVIVLHTPEPFYAVGQWYTLFDQTTDDEVLAALRPHTAQRQRGK